MRGNTWLDYDECQVLRDGLPWVPLLWRGHMHRGIVALADGPSTWRDAHHIREGIVIQPAIERVCPEIGRVCLKCVSNEYLAK